MPDVPYANAEIVWINEPAEDKRLVLMRGNTPEESHFTLERKDSQKDALGNSRWLPLEWNEDIIKTILISIFVKN